MIAVVRIRPRPHYRRGAFESGLSRLGYELRASAHPSSRDDLLVLWNRYGQDERDAEAWERDGGTVLVCENGYAGRDANGVQLYSISVGEHNGAGWFPVGTDDRLAPLGIAFAPWRSAGAEILVCGQRGIGSRRMASPSGWHGKAQAQAVRGIGRAARVRLHPGSAKPRRALEDDLADAWGCAIWSSGCGLTALAMGIPVFYAAPRWIAEAAAAKFGDWQAPVRDDGARIAAFQRLAHGQWRICEIETGEPFARMRDAGWGR